ATGQVGVAFSYTITATNNPTSYNATGLPAGLSVNTSTGVISGTPNPESTENATIRATNAGGTGSTTLTMTTHSASAVSQPAMTAGTYIVTISAAHAGGTGRATLTLTVSPAKPVITSSLSATGQVGVAFSYQITATNNPTSFNATGLPAGLSVNTSTGLISGTPTTAGTYSVTISATNAGGTGSATLTLTVVNPPPPVITSATTASGTVGVAFSYQITATD